MIRLLELAWSSDRHRSRITVAVRRVERRLEAVVGAAPGRMGVAAGSTLRAGGKRLRPLLVLLCCRSGAPLPRQAVRAATSVELLHMATLVHDDVLDRAELRRGLPTVAYRYGESAATSVGNYLFAAAFTEVVDTGDPRAVSRLSEAAAGLAQGELLQRDESFKADLTVAEYLRRCDLKTGGLFAAACALGGLVSGASDECVAALEDYGRGLGLAFQIFDDILDFCGETELTGKIPGADVRDGTVTLPLIHAIRMDPTLADRVERREKDDAEVLAILRDVRDSGALGQARATALGYIEQARSRLAEHGDEVEAGLLSQIAGMVVDRYS